MKVPWQKERSTGGETAVQLRSGGRSTFGRLESYVPLLDEVYAREVLTSDLDGAPELVQQGANANELIIPMMDMQGLADYSRNSGYVQGDVTLKNETVKCNFDRGRMFWVDSMDDLETAGIAFGRLAAEFIRTKVGPEIDAFRFATYCSKTGIGKKEETLADGAAVVAALRAATTAMDEDEVSEGDRYLYITPTLYGMISDLDTTKSREILTGIMPIRAFSREAFEEKRFDRANTDLMRTQLFTNRTMVAMMPFMTLIMNGTSLLIVWFGGKAMDNGTMQVGEMIAFITYTMQIVMSFLMLAMVAVMLPRAGVAAERIDEVTRQICGGECSLCQIL